MSLSVNGRISSAYHTGGLRVDQYVASVTALDGGTRLPQFDLPAALENLIRTEHFVH